MITKTMNTSSVSSQEDDKKEEYTYSDGTGDCTLEFKYTVVELVAIEVVSGANAISDGSSTPADTSCCAAIKGSGDIVLKAKLNPTIPSTSVTAGIITWNGGSAGATLDNRKVSKNSATKETITATCLNSTEKMVAYVIWCDTGSFGGHFSNNSKGFTSPGLQTVNGSTGQTSSTCEIEFTVTPPSLIPDGNMNLFDKSEILFDVSRDKRVKKWTKMTTLASWRLVDNRGSSWASDDSHDTEEDNNPWDGTSKLYGNDGPSNVPGATVGYVKKLNMREWVRVGFGGVTGRSGTICSSYLSWKCFRSLKEVNSTWSNDSMYGNVINTGNEFWGTVPNTN